MISLHNILSIALYERKTLLRSWFFRIFGILALVVLFGMNFGFLIQGGGPGGETWIIKSISSSIPYFNLLILNIAQAIIAVFLSSDFLKRDKKLDTTEVIYMRSMTNGEYVIGKTWGNLQVFLVLNLLVVILALIFNLLAKGTVIDWASYGFYLLTISVPTLIFIMGLSFLLMSIIRNQAITFVLILGYIGITLFLLQAKFYYIFDYMAFNIPMLKSDIVGFGNLETILVHRGIYLSLGLGFIFGTIFLLRRLPQSEATTVFSLVFSIVFIAGGGYLAYRHIDKFVKIENFRNEAVALNNKYVGVIQPSTLSNAIFLEHKGESIIVKSEMVLKNETTGNINQLVFSLNDGLQIASLKLNGTESQFLRDKQLIVVSDKVNLEPGNGVKVEFTYAGSINEALCYLDVEIEEIQKKYGKFVINVDKRYAFVEPEYVLLTPEANWYPKTGVTYSSENVGWYRPEFTKFSLDVKTAEGLQAVSQGIVKEIAAGHFAFESGHPEIQISLAIGKYKHESIKGKDVEFGIWYLEGHDYYKSSFKLIGDTIPKVLSDRFDDFKRNYKLNFADDKISVVEVPAQFKSYVRGWSSILENVQPEQVLIAEKGCMLRNADFEAQKKNVQRWHFEEEMTPEALELQVFEDFMRLFSEEQERNWSMQRGGQGQMSMGPNPYFIFPMLYNFQNNIQSSQWPITNRIFEAYLKSQVTDMRSVFMSSMQGQSADERANIALQDSTFMQILSDPKQKSIIQNVVKLKGDVLFSTIEHKVGQDEFKDFLRKMMSENTYRNITFESFSQLLKEKFGIEIISIMDSWFQTKTLPGFIFSPIKSVKVKSEDKMQTMVQFKITNFTNIAGLVKISFRMGGGPGGGRRMGGGMGGSDVIDKLVYLEAKQSKDLSYLIPGEPRMVVLNTMTSKNIPQTMMAGFRDIQEDPKAVPLEAETVSETPVQLTLPNEVVVDNEDPLFSITKMEKTTLLEKLVLKEKQSQSKYSGMNMWRPPVNWTAVTNSDFYGDYIRSAYYIKTGDGNMKAKWRLPLKEAGYYDVFVFMYKARFGGMRGGPGGGGGENPQDKVEFHFTIYDEDGAQDAVLESKNAEAGWNHLGSFNFVKDTAIVELSNKSEKPGMIFADAVKVVKL